MPLSKLRRIAKALDADLVVSLRWRGADLDRLADEGHARLVGRTTELLRHLGWDVKIEVSYAEYGERGSIDILAWHRGTRTVLVVEVKTELTAIEQTLRKHGEKTRLAERIAAGQLGWRPAIIASLLVLPARSTARRRVARHESVMTAAYPIRGAAVREWLRRPDSPMSGLLHLEDTSPPQTRTGRKRIRPSCPKVAGSKAA